MWGVRRMTTLITATTWGITNAQFLAAYATLCGAAGVGIWWQSRQARGAEERVPQSLAELDAYEIAMLGGGPQLTITSALTQLYRDGRLRVRRREGTLKLADARATAADPVERAVLEAVRDRPGISTAQLRRTLEHDEALRSISAQLREHGLLLDDEQASRLRRLGLVGVLLAGLGIARLVAAWSEDGAVGWVAAIVLVVAVATVWLLRHRPLATSRGRAVLERLRAEREELRRDAAASEGAMAVALFGGGALWLAEPAIAAAFEVPRESGLNGGDPSRGRGMDGGGGCGSAASCGGGGGSAASCGGGGGGGCGGGGGA